jgi:2,4-dienoyl-CoA reductase-like NADH-dependent reductase (Old Yellow Enzyme family)
MSTSPLFTPYTFRSGATAKNRITLAPLTNSQSHDDGILSTEELAWLARRAEGDCSIVMTCASHVCASGKGFDGQLGCFDPLHFAGFKDIAAACSRHGALSIAQLYHGGIRSPARLTGAPSISASDWKDGQGATARAATAAEVEEVIEDFVAAAHLAHRAGMSGIELHGAHGYLLCQFLSSVINTRSDGWGTSLAGRARLLRTITARIRQEIPKPFIVGIRLSPEALPNAPGIDLDEMIQVAQWLAEDGADFIDLSLWNYARKSVKRPQEYALPLFREALPKDVAVFAAGGMWTRADGETVLSQGADFLSLGRTLIVEPDWAKLARTPGFDPQRPPLTVAEYAERAVSERFAKYLRTSFKNMVKD